MRHDLWRRGFYYAPDGKGGGAGTGKPKPQGDGKPDPTKKPAAKKPVVKGKKPDPDDEADDDEESADDSSDEADDDDGDDEEGDTSAKKKPAERTYSKEDLERIVEKRLERDREKRERDEAKARRDQLREDGETDELNRELTDANTTLQAQNDAYETQVEAITEERDALEGSVTKYVNLLKKGHPEPVLKLLNSLPVADQLNWLIDNPLTEGEGDANGKKPPKKIPSTTKGDGDKLNKLGAEEDEEGRKAFSRTVHNSF